MSLSKSKCWQSNNCLHFSKRNYVNFFLLNGRLSSNRSVAVRTGLLPCRLTLNESKVCHLCFSLSAFFSLVQNSVSDSGEISVHFRLRTVYASDLAVVKRQDHFYEITSLSNRALSPTRWHYQSQV